MKIQAKILLKNRRVTQLGVDADAEFFVYKDGIYVVKSDLIRYNKENIAELFYFENNPTPVNRNIKDNSGDYLDRFIKINFIEQVSESFRGPTGLGSLIGKLMSNPQYIMLGIMALAILYSLIVSGGKII